MFRNTFLIIAAMLILVSCGQESKKEDGNKSEVLDKVPSGAIKENQQATSPAGEQKNSPVLRQKDRQQITEQGMEIQAADTGFMGPNTDPKKNLDVDKVAEVFFNRGIREFKAGRYEQSMQEFKKVTQVKPDHSKAYYNIGLCQYEMKNYYRAIDEFKTAFDLNSRDSIVALYIGISYNLLQNREKAIEYYNKALEIKPDFASAFYNRGTALAQQQKYHEALQDFNQAIEYQPEYKEAFVNRGNTYFSLGNRTAACEDWKRAIELGAKNMDQYVEDYCK